MDLFQFLVFLFVLLLSGTGATGSLRTSLDPGLEICILWRWKWAVPEGSITRAPYSHPLGAS